MVCRYAGAATPGIFMKRHNGRSGAIVPLSRISVIVCLQQANMEVYL
jgi:hypothetical protein